MKKLQELSELDVSDSMKRNIEALFGAMDTIDTSDSDEAKMIFSRIHEKVAEIEEYFWRPVDSTEVYERLIDIADKLGDSDKSSHYKLQINLFKANDLEFAGRVQDFFGNKVKALEYYERALELYPEHELALPAQTKALKNVDKARAEIPKLERKLSTHGDDPTVWIKYAVALLSVGEVEQAIQSFDKAIELDSENPDANARRGTAMESLGDYQGAKKYLQRALELKPNSMIAKRGINYADYFLEH